MMLSAIGYISTVNMLTLEKLGLTAQDCHAECYAVLATVGAIKLIECIYTDYRATTELSDTSLENDVVK